MIGNPVNATPFIDPSTRYPVKGTPILFPVTGGPDIAVAVRRLVFDTRRGRRGVAHDVGSAQRNRRHEQGAGECRQQSVLYPGRFHGSGILWPLSAIQFNALFWVLIDRTIVLL
jgi:hypothetical protein